MWNLVIYKVDLAQFLILGGRIVKKRTRGQEVKGKKGKNGNKQPQKSIIYVVAEGNTEKIYLKHFSNKEYNVYVVPVESGHTDAVGIVKFAKNEYINRRNMIDVKKGDRVYCVFDSDPASNPNIQEAFDLVYGSKDKGLECIFSNPCFEVWFVLHYKTAPKGKTAEEMKSKIKGLLLKEEKIKDYSETTDIFKVLEPLQKQALKRARQLHTFSEGVYDKVLSHECNPYTNIFEFIECIEECKQRNMKNKE